MITTITVKERTRRKLQQLKERKPYHSFDHLLEMEEKDCPAAEISVWAWRHQDLRFGQGDRYEGLWLPEGVPRMASACRRL